MARYFVLVGAVVLKYNLMLPMESADLLAATLALDGSWQTTADELLVFSWVAFLCSFVFLCVSRGWFPGSPLAFRSWYRVLLCHCSSGRSGCLPT